MRVFFNPLLDLRQTDTSTLPSPAALQLHGLNTISGKKVVALLFWDVVTKLCHKYPKICHLIRDIIPNLKQLCHCRTDTSPRQKEGFDS